MVTFRPVRLASDCALVPAGSGTQLSISVADSSCVCRAPRKSSFCQRHNSPVAHSPRRGGAASATVAGSRAATASAPTDMAVSVVLPMVSVVLRIWIGPRVWCEIGQPHSDLRRLATGRGAAASTRIGDSPAGTFRRGCRGR